MNTFDAISTKELFLELLKRKDIYSERGYYHGMAFDDYRIITKFNLTKKQWEEHFKYNEPDECIWANK